MQGIGIATARVRRKGEAQTKEVLLMKRERCQRKKRLQNDNNVYLTEIPVFPFLPIPSFSSTSLPDNILPLPLPLPLFFATSNTFQNFKSSSELAVATVVPSGLNAECRILA
jgi:hypothetical protein